MAKIIKIPSVEVIDTKVVGVSKNNDDGTSRQDIIRNHVEENDPVSFQHDPNNPYDSEAMKVLIKGNLQIGFLKRDIAPKVKSAMENESEIIAKASWVSGEAYVGVGLRIELVS